jgi:hypothetical protein
MIKTYILILLITSGSSGGESAVVAEFNSFEKCNKAGQLLVKGSNKSQYYGGVRAWGCFEK